MAKPIVPRPAVRRNFFIHPLRAEAMKSLKAKHEVQGAPSLETLLLQAQLLLNDADEANHGGHVITYDLQRQARELLAEAIDELPAEQTKAHDPSPLERVDAALARIDAAVPPELARARAEAKIHREEADDLRRRLAEAHQEVGRLTYELRASCNEGEL